MKQVRVTITPRRSNNKLPTPRLNRNPTATFAPAEPKPNWPLRIAIAFAFVVLVISTNPELLL